ncbi:hypothetical protein DIPPA_16392 [Diplonema papillatum]|nr:hypothetical protein DIPPA_16392 [Diplonema papillatum]
MSFSRRRSASNVPPAPAASVASESGDVKSLPSSAESISDVPRVDSIPANPSSQATPLKEPDDPSHKRSRQYLNPMLSPVSFSSSTPFSQSARRQTDSPVEHLRLSASAYPQKYRQELSADHLIRISSAPGSASSKAHRGKRTGKLGEARSRVELSQALSTLRLEVKQDLTDQLSETRRDMDHPSQLQSEESEGRKWCEEESGTVPLNFNSEKRLGVTRGHSGFGMLRIPSMQTPSRHGSLSVINQMKRLEELQEIVTCREEEILECVRMGERLVEELRQREEEVELLDGELTSLRTEHEDLQLEHAQLVQETTREKHADRITVVLAMEELAEAQKKLQEDSDRLVREKDDMRWVHRHTVTNANEAAAMVARVSELQADLAAQRQAAAACSLAADEAQARAAVESAGVAQAAHLLRQHTAAVVAALARRVHDEQQAAGAANSNLRSAQAKIATMQGAVARLQSTSTDAEKRAYQEVLAAREEAAALQDAYERAQLDGKKLRAAAAAAEKRADEVQGSKLKELSEMRSKVDTLLDQTESLKSELARERDVGELTRAQIHEELAAEKGVLAQKLARVRASSAAEAKTAEAKLASFKATLLDTERELLAARDEVEALQADKQQLASEVGHARRLSQTERGTLRDALSSLETEHKLLVSKLAKTKAKAQGCDREIAALRESLEAQEADRRRLGEEITRVREAAAQGTEAVRAALEESIGELEADRTALSGEIAAARAKSLGFDRERANLQAEIDGLSAEKAALAQGMAAARAKALKELDRERSNRAAEVGELLESNEALTGEVKDLRAKALAAQREALTHKAAADALQQENEALSARLVQSNSRRAAADVEGELHGLRCKADAWADERRALSAELSAARSRLLQHELELASLQATHEGVVADRRAVKADLEAALAAQKEAAARGGEQTRAQLEQAAGEKTRLSRENDELKAANAALAAQREAAARELAAAEAAARQADAVGKESERKLQAARARATAERDALTAEVQSLGEERAALDEEAAGLRGELAASNRDRRALEVDLARADRERATLRKQLDTKASRCEELETELSDLCATLKERSGRLEAHAVEIKEIDEARRQVEKQKRTLSSSLTEARAEARQQGNDLRQLEAQRNEYAGAYRELAAQHDAALAKLSELESHLQLFQLDKTDTDLRLSEAAGKQALFLNEETKLRHDNATLIEKSRQLEHALSEVRSAVAVVEYELKEKEAERRAMEDELMALRATVFAVERLAEKTGLQETDARRELSVARTRGAQLEHDRKDMEREILRLTSLAAAARDEMKAAARRADETGGKLAEKEAECCALRDELEKFASRDPMIEQLASRFYAVKALAEKRASYEEKLAVYQASVGDLLALSERPVDAVARSGSPPAAQLLLGTDQQLSARFHKLQSQLSRLDEECLQTHKCHRDVSSEMERTNHILRLGLSTSRARIGAAAVNAMLSNT